jgi:hypothetical protein
VNQIRRRILLIGDSHTINIPNVEVHYVKTAHALSQTLKKEKKWDAAIIKGGSQSITVIDAQALLQCHIRRHDMTIIVFYPASGGAGSVNVRFKQGCPIYELASAIMAQM